METPPPSPSALPSVPAAERMIDFEEPPVVEVVAGVRFAPLSIEAGHALGEFWRAELRGLYPMLQEQPYYDPPREEFSEGVRQASFTMTIGGSAPGARLWCVSEDGRSLLQLQPNWFACNWRKVGPGDAYETWPKRHDSFADSYGRFCGWLEREFGLRPQVEQCEVTYINHILPGSVWQTHADADKIFTLIDAVATPGQLRLEDINWRGRYRDTTQGVDARLHIGVQSGFSVPETRPLYVMELTARGVPQSLDAEGVLAFLDHGRALINMGFESFTSPEVREMWGQVELS